MAILAGQPWRLKALIYAAAVAAVLAFTAALGGAIALAGLGRLSGEVRWERAPFWFWYFRDDPQVRRWLAIGFSASAGLLAAGVIALLRRPRSQHGAARWASEAELRQAGLRARSGLLLGERGGRFLRFGGEEHVLVYAPTRSGKGVGFVIPNLLTWDQSAVVLDIKAENFAATAGRRAAMGQKIILFDPFARDGRTARFNPLGHIAREDELQCLRELRKVAILLFPEQHKGDFFWVGAARNAFVALGAYVAGSARSHPHLTLGAITRELTVSNLKQRLFDIINARSSGPSALSPLCLRLLQDVADSPDNTFGGIRQTVTARLSLWLSPEVDNATSSSDFELGQLRAKPTTVYLAVGPADLALVAPLYALIMQQVVEHNAQALPAPGDDRRLLLMLDEFARLGFAPALAGAFSYLAGYGVRLAAVIQTPAQLRHLYGADGAREIIANCGAELVFAPKALEDARDISGRLGDYDFATTSKSRPAGLGSGRRTVSQSKAARPLMLAQELLTLPADRGLVLRTGSPPTLCRKIVWHRDRRFQKLRLDAPVIRSIVMTRADHIRPFQPTRAADDLFSGADMERAR